MKRPDVKVRTKKTEYHLYDKPRKPEDEPFLVFQCHKIAVEYADKLDLELVESKNTQVGQHQFFNQA